MYIDVLGYSSVSEAVHEASRMLRVGIVHAMAKGIDDDLGSTEIHDRQKSQADTSQFKISQAPEKEHVSVYSSVTKRARRPIPGAVEAHLQEPNPQQLDQTSSTAHRGAFAPRSWSSTKKAGPSILSKRNRSAALNSNAGGGSGSTSVFHPGPKREKHAEMPTREGTSGIVVQPSEKSRPVGSGSVMAEGSTRQLSSSRSTKDETQGSRTGCNMLEESISSARTATPSTSNDPGSSHTMLKHVRASSALKEKAQGQNEIAKPQRAALSPGARKVGLPPSWCQVSAKSFKNNGVTRSTSALSLLRKPGAVKPRPLRAAPRGSTALPTVPTMRRTGNSSLLTSKSGQSVSDNPGLIPLPSSTGIKVKYVPGSEIIDGVRPNGYTVSIDGVVKPVVTFNPKPKLPHKLRQNSVEKLFEAWRDNRKVAEGDALARALRAEQEMYARAASRADYRAAVTVKLKDIRKLDN